MTQNKQYPAGSEIALSWSPMRLKIFHWRPEFHNYYIIIVLVAPEIFLLGTVDFDQGAI